LSISVVVSFFCNLILTEEEEEEEGEEKHAKTHIVLARVNVEGDRVSRFVGERRNVGLRAVRRALANLNLRDDGALADKHGRVERQLGLLVRDAGIVLQVRTTADPRSECGARSTWVRVRAQVQLVPAIWRGQVDLARGALARLVQHRGNEQVMTDDVLVGRVPLVGREERRIKRIRDDHGARNWQTVDEVLKHCVVHELEKTVPQPDQVAARGQHGLVEPLLAGGHRVGPAVVFILKRLLEPLLALADVVVAEPRQQAVCAVPAHQQLRVSKVLIVAHRFEPAHICARDGDSAKTQGEHLRD